MAPSLYKKSASLDHLLVGTPARPDPLAATVTFGPELPTGIAMRLLGIILTSLLVAAPAQAADPAQPLPALLEPYAGYDVVFGPNGPRVLGPEAAPAVERMVTRPEKQLAQSGCEVGDIGLQGAAITVQAACPGGAASAVLDASAAQLAKASVLFSATWTGAWPEAAKAELLRRVAAGEAAIAWQRVRPPPGSPADGVLTALIDAHAAIAIGDRATAVVALAAARAAQAEVLWSAQACFDFALLAEEAADAAHRTWARACLQRTLAAQRAAPQGQFAGPDSAQLRGMAIAARALAGDPSGTAQQAAGCSPANACDVLPAVRALAAVRAFSEAANLLDRTLLAQGKPGSQDLLKLRFGLASALGDAQGEIATAKRIASERPDAVEAADLLAAGLSRAGRWREAIEILHNLSKAHPERDIVLGRIAGMINFLTDAAGADPARKADLDAIEERMRLASADPNDVVARFIVATRSYYSGHLGDALPLLQALNQTTNRDPRLPLYLAMTHFWLGHQAEAHQLIQHAVAIGPSDPDVFYCRSQIVRGVNLPLAIRDLERYEQMTKQPWSIGPAQKAQRVTAELTFMRKGLLPPAWDKPGPDRAAFLPDAQTGTAVADAVRSGANWLPGAETPTVAAGVATPTDLAAAVTPPTVAQPAPPPGDDPAPWWPVAVLAGVGAALLARWWSAKNPESPADDRRA